jgi:hypothetical protein
MNRTMDMMAKTENLLAQFFQHLPPQDVEAFAVKHLPWLGSNPLSLDGPATKKLLKVVQEMQLASPYWTDRDQQFQSLLDFVNKGITRSCLNPKLGRHVIVLADDCGNHQHGWRVIANDIAYEASFADGTTELVVRVEIDEIINGAENPREDLYIGRHRAPLAAFRNAVIGALKSIGGGQRFEALKILDCRVDKANIRPGSEDAVHAVVDLLEPRTGLHWLAAATDIDVVRATCFAYQRAQQFAGSLAEWPDEPATQHVVIARKI